MRKTTIREEDSTLQWRGNIGRLVKVRLKDTRVMEMWYNEQITEENTREITTLNIIKSGRLLVLKVYPKKNICVKPNLGRTNVPVLFIRAPINRRIFGEIFGETLRS